MQSEELGNDEIFNSPPKQDYPGWLKPYIDEDTGLVDYDQLIRDGRYGDYQRWLQTRITPVTPRSRHSVEGVEREVRINVWGSMSGSDCLN